MKRTLLAASLLTLGLSGCVSDEHSQLLGAGVKAWQGFTLSKSELQAQASLSAKQMDRENELAPKDSKYSKRLDKLTANLLQVDGTPLNFQVYLDDEINAFAMPDGTIRVYSGLMDAMHDDELVAVIGHEMGHIKHEHSLSQFKATYMAAAARQAASAFGEKAAKLASSEYADMGVEFMSAQFSQKDELESDLYGIEVLCQLNMDPYAALRAQQVLLKHAASEGGLFATHPSSNERIDQARTAAGNASCRS
ncbi:peptidase [Oceanisphaera profunda]|uniref:Peptidase n=1 Tax=Oceanisphaera profunda TaxID=1416627 RepID=A0A1Y0D3R4_9GAMM|nr:M48 family metalloprotease [Oceanisphaera profunda]ART81745.1 peptidase [Oceanisphaera profunda]